MANLAKGDVREIVEQVKELYLIDKLPWICGYSGGKDSTAIVQLVWSALSELPQKDLKKAVHIISTDTLVESPVVSVWATESLNKMKKMARERKLPRTRRDFRRKNGALTYHSSNNALVHGPYTKETRRDFLTRLLEVEKLIHEIGPESIKDIPLITKEELRLIRHIWLEEKHEFEDLLPTIYEQVTGNPFEDGGAIKKNKYFGQEDANLLDAVCSELYPSEDLLPILQRALLDIEAKAVATSKKSSVIPVLESEIKKTFYKNETDAENIARNRSRQTIHLESFDDDELVD